MRDYLRTVSLCFDFGKTTELQSRSRESGFKPPMSDAHLTIYRAVKLNSVNPIKPALSHVPAQTQTLSCFQPAAVERLLSRLRKGAWLPRSFTLSTIHSQLFLPPSGNTN